MTAVPLLRVESPGLLSTVQDEGRWGYQRDGMVVAGAMDPFAAAVANLLLGSPRGAAVIEITLLGPSLRALADVRLALCGGDLSPSVDGLPVSAWKTCTLREGQALTFGRRRSGARAYLSVTGGFQVPAILGSRATFLRARLGGFDGRPLRAGDVLEGVHHPPLHAERGLRPADIPAYTQPAVLRVLPGPHLSAFTGEGLDTFFSSTYTVSPQSDRQGYRLSGPAVARVGAADILSEAMPWGGVQVPLDGSPILLMADRQTTGGYPLVAVVLSTDLPRAGQLAPGDAVRFQAVTLAEAHDAALSQERWLRAVGVPLSGASADPPLGGYGG